MTLLVTGSPADLASFLNTLAGQNRIDQKLDFIIQSQEKILVTLEEEKKVLSDIDDATTKTGANVQKVADNVQVIATTATTISDEVDQLLAKNVDTIPTEVADQLNSIKERVNSLGQAAQLSSDALDAQVPVLTAIASKGAANPVPVAPVA